MSPSTHLASASSKAGMTARPVTNTTPKITNMATHSFEWANYLQRDTCSDAIIWKVNCQTKDECVCYCWGN
ncbi:MAG: hypothetical protein H0X50_07400 [Nitrosopumilus sp.]|nr:hypothetical protein [Nitrosopumilus sp.]